MGLGGEPLRKTGGEKRIPPAYCYQPPKPKHEMQLYSSKYEGIVEAKTNLDLRTLDFTVLTVK